MRSTATITSTRRLGALRPALAPIWRTGALAGSAAAIATTLYGVAARAADIPMSAGAMGSKTAQPITVGSFAMGTLICTFWGTVLAAILARRARHPAQTFATTAVVLTVLSLASPLGAGHTAVSTKAMLAIAHVLAAAIVIPTLTRRLAHAPGRDGQRRLSHRAARASAEGNDTF
jgi:heme A synthase